MPYSIRKSGSKYQIVRKDTGKVVGTSTSLSKAKASVRARLAGEHGWVPTGKGKRNAQKARTTKKRKAKR